MSRREDFRLVAGEGRYYLSLITLLLLSGCGTQTHQSFYGDRNFLTGTNYLTFEHAFTDAGAEDARRRAEAQCQQRKKTAVKTEGRCTLQSCITSFQCMDADEAAAYQGEARK